MDPLGFRWDADKAEANIAKHAIAFEDAVRIFGGLTYDVASINRGELRIASTGDLDGIEITVVYTDRGGEYRIISARRAGKREREIYRAYCTLLRR